MKLEQPVCTRPGYHCWISVALAADEAIYCVRPPSRTVIHDGVNYGRVLPVERFNWLNKNPAKGSSHPYPECDERFNHL